MPLILILFKIGPIVVSGPGFVDQIVLPQLKKKQKTGLAMEGRKEMFYLTTHSTHFIYGYMASDIW